MEGGGTDANVVTISDRRVGLPGPGAEAPSLYALMRAWVRNAPDIPYVQEVSRRALRVFLDFCRGGGVEVGGSAEGWDKGRGQD